MDRSIDPCQDFYQYSCGNWVHEHPLYGKALEASRFSEARHSLATEIKDILEAKNVPGDPKPVQQARSLYHTCMDTEVLEILGLKPVTDILGIFGLSGRVPSSGTTEFFNLTRTLALIEYHLTISDLIVTVGVSPSPRDSSVRMLLLTPPRVDVQDYSKYSPIVGPDPEYYVKEEDSLPERLKNDLNYRSMIMAVFEKAYHPEHQYNMTELRVAAMKTLLLEAQIVKLKSGDAETVEKKISEMQNELNNLLKKQNLSSDNELNLKQMIEILFQNIKNCHPDKSILVHDYEYFKKVVVILAKSRTETIQRLIWWKVVNYLSMLSTMELRSLKHSRAKPNSNYGAIPRSKECLMQIHDLMPAAVSYKIATNPAFNTTKKRVEEMLGDISKGFVSLLNEAEWMDKETRERALDKVTAMGHMIGFPHYLVEAGYIEQLYSEIVVEEGRFLQSVVNIHTAEAKRILSHMKIPAKRKDYTNELPDPFIVNAFNAITHNFIGRHFDKKGNQKNWWSNSTSVEFNNRAECFMKQYGSYNVYGHKVDGKRTLGENIADNGGLRESVRAYHNFVARNGPEAILPGFQNYTHDQLLYLAFANVWCSTGTKEAELLRLNDVHSPPRLRVIGTLTNMEDFAKTWKCPPGSAMHPRNKCVLW
ncbi:hypothetical protein C0J52_02674 [Blattella germanica]|nr:hypothetical protein C0J52_02674 [Blattella germanica]